MSERRARSLWSDVLAVAYKEAMVLRHDRPLIATLLVQPISFLIILGVAVSYTPRNVHWAVLDRSQTAVSRRLVSEIEDERLLPAGRADPSYEEGNRLLQTGKMLAVVVIDATSPATSSAAGRESRCCSTAPSPCRPPASAARSRASPPPSIPATTARAHDPTRSSRRAGRSTSASASGSTRP